jgi:hypothetical protein
MALNPVRSHADGEGVQPDSRLAPLDLGHAENAGVLAYLGRDAKAVPIARPSSSPDPYFRAGAHPEIVERVWDELGRNLPRAARALVYGTPALVHPKVGLVLALALGTSYALRLPPERLTEAGARAFAATHRFSSGTTLDLAIFGPGWRYGAWREVEPEWLEEELERLAANT